jgi:hypothetical protein
MLIYDCYCIMCLVFRILLFQYLRCLLIMFHSVKYDLRVQQSRTTAGRTATRSERPSKMPLSLSLSLSQALGAPLKDASLSVSLSLSSAQMLPAWGSTRHSPASARHRQAPLVIPPGQFVNRVLCDSEVVVYYCRTHCNAVRVTVRSQYGSPRPCVSFYLIDTGSTGSRGRTCGLPVYPSLRESPLL